MLAGSGTGAPPLALEGRIGRLDLIVSYCCSGQTGFYALGRWLVIDCKGHTDGLDGMYGLDGTLVGRGWDGQTLAGSRTGARPSALEGRIGRLDPIVSYCCSGKNGFYALGRWLVTYCKGHTDGLDGMLVVRGWDGPTLAGAGTGAPPLALEGRRAVGSVGCRQLLRLYKGRGVFVSEQQNNTNRLQTNRN